MNEALERLDDLGYERGGDSDLANHGPMGAEALAVLGHGDAVARWVEGYRRATSHHGRPTPYSSLDPADESSWRPALGAFERVGDWEQLFRRELADAPWRQVLSRWWPRLLPGLFSGLTHGPIRTAHALRSVAGTPTPSPAQFTELARGLAYWAARFTTLPGQARFSGRHDVADAIAVLPRVPIGTPRPPAVILRDRLPKLGDMPGYVESLGAVAPDNAQWLLSEMTAEFAGMCIAHPELNPIPLIHGVTAPAAIRLALPHLPVELHEPSVAALWQVHTALLLIFTGDRRDEGTAGARAIQAEVPAFEELVYRAVEHGDEHVIKFTEACLREHALRPDPRYPAAVLTAQQRIARRPG